MTGIAVVAVRSIAHPGLIVFKGTLGTATGSSKNGQVHVFWDHALSWDRESAPQSKVVQDWEDLSADPMDLEWAAPPVVSGGCAICT